MALLSPDFALTCVPGCSLVPCADFVMFATCKSSTHTNAWFLLIVVEVLWKVVMADAGDPGVQTLNTVFSLGPVVAELYFVAQLLFALCGAHFHVV